MDSFTSFIPNTISILIYSVFIAFLILTSILLPAKIVKGHPNPKRGKQLQYSINGFYSLILTIGLYVSLSGMLFPFELFRGTIIAQNIWPLLSTVFFFSLLLSILLYLKSSFKVRISGQQIEDYTHGSFLSDFWIGKQLNPRIGNFDLKFFSYRPAMIFWILINLSYLHKNIQLMNTITFRMLFYQAFTFIYVFDYLWYEQKMLTTWDIISQEFGFMLIFGDYVFIPFVFSIQARYLYSIPDYTCIYDPALTLLIFILGYYIFRSANSQKNQFKKNPSQAIWGNPPKTINGKILISGWWGLARHMNYTGDLLMSISYCLTCWNAGWQCWIYTIYLHILLLQRAYRDDRKCKQKYKKLWDQYQQKVPYMFMPFVLDHLYKGIGKLQYKLTMGGKQQKSQ